MQPVGHQGFVSISRTVSQALPFYVTHTSSSLLDGSWSYCFWITWPFGCTSPHKLSRHITSTSLAFEAGMAWAWYHWRLSGTLLSLPGLFAVNPSLWGQVKRCTNPSLPWVTQTFSSVEQFSLEMNLRILAWDLFSKNLGSAVHQSSSGLLDSWCTCSQLSGGLLPLH